MFSEVMRPFSTGWREGTVFPRTPARNQQARRRGTERRGALLTTDCAMSAHHVQAGPNTVHTKSGGAPPHSKTLARLPQPPLASGASNCRQVLECARCRGAFHEAPVANIAA